jgi:hypothetical protein
VNQFTDLRIAQDRHRTHRTQVPPTCTVPDPRATMRQIRVFDLEWLSSSQPHLFKDLQPTSAQLPRGASVLRARYLDGSCKPC